MLPEKIVCLAAQKNNTIFSEQVKWKLDIFLPMYRILYVRIT